MAEKKKWVRLSKLYDGKYGKIGTLRGDNLTRFINMIKYVANADREKVDGITFAVNKFDGDFVLSATPAAPYKKEEKKDDGWEGEDKKKDDEWGGEPEKKDEPATEEPPF